MPLKLSLLRGEKLVVNGAVIKNDGPDVNLVFENQAHILRQKDIMTLEDATGVPIEPVQDDEASPTCKNVEEVLLYPCHVDVHV